MPTDFSEPSREALAHAVSVACWYASEIMILHVSPSPAPADAPLENADSRPRAPSRAYRTGLTPPMPAPAMKRLVSLVALAVALSACGSRPMARIPVSAPEGELAALAGEWTGGFTDARTGSAGTVRLVLAAADTSATGEIVLVPGSGASGARPANRRAGSEAGAAQVLAVRFVRVEDGGLSGTLEPWLDPECGCVMSTTFTGRRRGDTIEGRFDSYGGPFHVASSGTWQVRRAR